MIVKPFQNLELSALGMGIMRLPTTSERGPIDEPKALEMIRYAYEHGINYFDTAYRYHSGESEILTGKALRDYPRGSFCLATKMPGNFMRFENGKCRFVGFLEGLESRTPQQIFEEQLNKCGVEYFDFYLLHGLSEASYPLYVNEELGIVDFLLQQKKKGRIRHLGFSAHAQPETIEKFLSWRDCFEFAQIQINYLDWTLQNAQKTYGILTDRKIPVIAMEPCRGGKLTTLSGKAADILHAARPEDSQAKWAFRFLQSLDNVQVTLSGMSTLDQVKENIEIFSEHSPLSENEKQTLASVVDSMLDLVPCTACGYCVDDCPSALDIPKLISMYNETKYEKSFTVHNTLSAMREEERPAACVSCGTCEKLCPQGIPISNVLRSFAELIAKG